MTVFDWLIAIPLAAFALTFWLGILIAAIAAAAAAVTRFLRPRLEVRRGLRDLERGLADRGES